MTLLHRRASLRCYKDPRIYFIQTFGATSYVQFTHGYGELLLIEYPVELCHWTIERFEIFPFLSGFCAFEKTPCPKQTTRRCLYLCIFKRSISPMGPIAHLSPTTTIGCNADYVTQKINSNTTSWNMISTGREGSWSRLLLVVNGWFQKWRYPKMDGENNGKPYYNRWFGGYHYFLNVVNVVIVFFGTFDIGLLWSQNWTLLVKFTWLRC